MQSKVFLAIGILAILFLGLVGYVVSDPFGGFFTQDLSSKEGLIANYQQKESQLLEAKRYLNCILPQGIDVDIEFGNDRLEIFHLKKGRVYDRNWQLSYEAPKIDSMLCRLGWSRQQLNILKDKLSAANCISIKSGHPVTIGWQRSVLGKYFYKIFDRDLDTSQVKLYNDSCKYIFYKENIVLEYGGGAVGSQCFER